jgi:hypothetical protein
MGKMIECASLVAEPFMGKEAIVGTITQDDIKITPYHPDQRCTIASVAGHSMYERETPVLRARLGGLLDMKGLQGTSSSASAPRASPAPNGYPPRSCA